MPWKNSLDKDIEKVILGRENNMNEVYSKNNKLICLARVHVEKSRNIRIEMRNIFWWQRNLTLFCTSLFLPHPQGNGMINILEKWLWQQWFCKWEKESRRSDRETWGCEKGWCIELVRQWWSMKSKLSHT